MPFVPRKLNKPIGKFVFWMFGNWVNFHNVLLQLQEKFFLHECLLGESVTLSFQSDTKKYIIIIM